MVAGQRPETKGQTDCVELPAQETGQANIYTMGTAVLPQYISCVPIFKRGFMCQYHRSPFRFADDLFVRKDHAVLADVAGVFPNLPPETRKTNAKATHKKTAGTKTGISALVIERGDGRTGAGGGGSGGGARGTRRKASYSVIEQYYRTTLVRLSAEATSS